MKIEIENNSEVPQYRINLMLNSEEAFLCCQSSWNKSLSVLDMYTGLTRGNFQKRKLNLPIFKWKTLGNVKWGIYNLLPLIINYLL